MPLAFDRASESKVGVFYTKLGERTGNNDHVVVRILNKNKQNLTMYSVKLFRYPWHCSISTICPQY